MLPLDKVQSLIDRHSKLENKLSSGEIETKKYAEISKEYSDLNEIINNAKDYLSFKKETEDLNNIISDLNTDTELKEFAKRELENLKKFLIKEKIKLYLLQKIKQTAKMLLLKLEPEQEVSKLVFLRQIYTKCMKVCQKKKWNLEIISISKSDAGGLKEVIALIKGKNIYSSLKYESGVHRVQRVPDTETQGEFIHLLQLLRFCQKLKIWT